jgi:protein-tyrosine-phosphatase
VYVLKDYVDTDPGDVIDPFGGGQVEYEACASELEELIRLLVEKLQNQQQSATEQQNTE